MATNYLNRSTYFDCPKQRFSLHRAEYRQSCGRGSKFRRAKKALKGIKFIERINLVMFKCFHPYVQA